MRPVREGGCHRIPLFEEQGPGRDGVVMDVVGGCDLPVDVLGRAPNSEENVVGLANSTVLLVLVWAGRRRV